MLKSFILNILFPKNNKGKDVPTILFYRDFIAFTGGHLKVWEYYSYINNNKNYKAEIYFSDRSAWENNPWNSLKNKCLTTWKPEKSDILFLAGMDWLALSEPQRRSPPSPIINLIQHVRHSDQSNPLYEFLKYPAIRICVSQEVKDAIIKTGVVNGPVYSSPNGIDHSIIPLPLEKINKDIPLLIVGIKNSKLAEKINQEITNIDTHLLIEHIPRNDFLNLLNRAVVTLFLPSITEGFYLPALEAMYLESFVICPDCIGNRSFCINNETCLLPPYSFKKIIEAIEQYYLLTQDDRTNILSKAKTFANRATLEREKQILFKILSDI